MIKINDELECVSGWGQPPLLRGARYYAATNSTEEGTIQVYYRSAPGNVVVRAKGWWDVNRFKKVEKEMKEIDISKELKEFGSHEESVRNLVNKIGEQQGFKVKERWEVEVGNYYRCQMYGTVYLVAFDHIHCELRLVSISGANIFNIAPESVYCKYLKKITKQEAFKLL